MKTYTCPCCGYPGLDYPPYANYTDLPLPEGAEPPYRHTLGKASYDVCPCCTFEFGLDDEYQLGTAGDSFQQYLADWIAEGCAWLTPSDKPEGWTLEQQLADAGIPMPR